VLVVVVVVVVVVVDVDGGFSTGKLWLGCSASAGTATTLFDVEPVFVALNTLHL